MKTITALLICALATCCMLQAQSKNNAVFSVELKNKLTISGFCLCRSTLTELKSLDSNLKKVDINEISLCDDGFVQDARFTNGIGYSSSKYPGIIFQKDKENDFLSKIRLTKDFVGKLPDGTSINMKTLLAKDVIKLYPGYDKSWTSRDCSAYWNLTNDTLSFFVKIDSTRKPRYPLDKAYYLEKPVEEIELVISCRSIFNTGEKAVLLSPADMVFFLDSIKANADVLKDLHPQDIAMLSVYKNADSLKIKDLNAKNGIVYITTKAYARKHYWNYFKSISPDYAKQVPDLDAEAELVYILNGKVLTTNYESVLFDINDSNLIELKLIDKKTLKREYDISVRAVGVVIKTKKK
ncbi:MAG: hypothetical protein ABIN01_25635 [Ferruginibacter sp.]